jgi:uncharacterized protein YndB with AHSA1/START domain
MTENRDIESVERTIPQPAEAIFAFLAAPRRHHEIDGSGTVHEAKSGPERVKLGDKFTMAMKRGVPYKTHNTVVEFEDNRRIAWQPRATEPFGSIFGGPIWRYELEPVEGGTRVIETWDISTTRLFKPVLRLERARKETRDGMQATLEKIEKLLAGS